MNARTIARLARLALVPLFLSFGCGKGGPEEDTLENPNPGTNDLNVVVAFGDSLTRGSECACDPYPRRLAALVGKTVLNTGVSASRAIDNVSRTQEAIDKYHPAFMLILYGINDLIASAEVDSVLAALDQMLTICETNQVVPALATYPRPVGDHLGFAERTLFLNEGIRQLAKTRGLFCVDLEREFDADPALYEADGLHPNDAGTQLMALAFADLF